jgi:hypothetical protein
MGLGSAKDTASLSERCSAILGRPSAALLCRNKKGHEHRHANGDHDGESPPHLPPPLKLGDRARPGMELGAQMAAVVALASEIPIDVFGGTLGISLASLHRPPVSPWRDFRPVTARSIWVAWLRIATAAAVGGASMSSNSSERLRRIRKTPRGRTTRRIPSSA